MDAKYTLRAHHGLCLFFFKGIGYSDGFVGNMTKMKGVLENNPLVCITNQVDMICCSCPNNESGKCLSEQKVCGYDRQILQRCGLKPDVVMPYFEFQKLIHDNILAPGKREEVCADCEWTSLCITYNSPANTGRESQ